MIIIIYDGKIIHKNLTEEQCSELLLELAEKFYNNELDVNKIELVETE